MKNKFKIITVILSCLLLIGAAVGFYASAADADAPEITIYKRSVSYEGAPRIVYLIETANAENYTAKIVFSKDNAYKPSVDDVINDAGAAGAYSVGKIGGKQAYGGKEYDYICSNGIAPAFATRPEYAYPVLVDAGNKIVAVGALDEYSLFDYYTTRLSSDGVGDVSANLYKAALAYSASVQDVLIEENPAAYSEADLEKYGYADAYYVVNATINVDGEYASTEKVCYRESEVTLNPKKSYGSTIFAGFEKDGEKVGAYGDNTASSWNYYDTTLKIGQNNFTYNYTSGSVYDWDNVTTLASNSKIFSPYNSSGVSLDAKSDTLLSAYTENGALVIDSPPLKENFIWDATSRLINTNNKTGAVGSVYVFETDFRIDFNPADYTNYDRAIGYLGMATKGYGGSDQTFVTFPIAWSSAKDNTYFFRLADVNFANTWDLAHLTFGEWYNIRIEYKITSLGTTNITPESSTATGTVSFYLNGELKSTHDVTGNSNGDSNETFGIFGIQDQQGRFGNHNIYFDNTYIATED